MSGTNGSSGLGSQRRLHIDNRTRRREGRGEKKIEKNQKCTCTFYRRREGVHVHFIEGGRGEERKGKDRHFINRKRKAKKG